MEKCWVIRMNRKVILNTFAGMVLPSRDTIPMHFGVIIETTVQTGQCHIQMIMGGHDYMLLLFGKIHEYKMGIDTCNRRGSQDHEMAEVIQED